MKKTIRETENPLSLRDICDKLDILAGKVDELLRRVPPGKPLEKSEIVAHNEPQHRPSSYSASRAAREHDSAPLVDEPLRSYPPNIPRIDKNLGSL